MPALLLFIAAVVVAVVTAASPRIPGVPRPRRLRLALGLVAAGLAVAACLLEPFEARKLAGLALMPVGLVWLGLAALALASWRQRRRGTATAAAVLWLLLGLAGNGHVAAALVGRLEAGYAPAHPLASGPFDVALVLGGGVSISPGGEAELSESADRVLFASRLFRAGRTPLLAVSGPYLRLPDGRSLSYPRAEAGVLEELGVPRGRIVLVEGPRATGEEIAAYASLAHERGWRRIALITSGWHLPRALRHCRRLGLSVTPLPSDPTGPAPPWRLRDVMPDAKALQRTSIALWEMVGSFAGY
jgi:uncharacterized SAM-binding protein YcdF (DUF218 family)